jgi:hypothetical protein
MRLSGSGSYAVVFDYDTLAMELGVPHERHARDLHETAASLASTLVWAWRTGSGQRCPFPNGTAATGLGKAQRSSAPVLLPYDPGTSPKERYIGPTRRDRQLLVVLDILREIRGLPTRPQDDS